MRRVRLFGKSGAQDSGVGAGKEQGVTQPGVGDRIAVGAGDAAVAERTPGADDQVGVFTRAAIFGGLDELE